MVWLNKCRVHGHHLWKSQGGPDPRWPYLWKSQGEGSGPPVPPLDLRMVSLRPWIYFFFEIITFCFLLSFICVLTEITPQVVQEKIDTIQKNLTVNRKETNQYIRTLTSAPDERSSARNIGIVGVSVICGVFGLIILSDCTSVIKAIQSKCQPAKDRWNTWKETFAQSLHQLYFCKQSLPRYDIVKVVFMPY
jgi:hypothetical protein